MNLHTVTAKGERTLPALLLFFLAFRLIYIPASVLTHTGHGLPWLTAALGWLVTFGGEWLTRNRSGLLPSESGVPLNERRRGLAVVVLALILLGLFPEEAPIGLILWAGMGVAWGVAMQNWPYPTGWAALWDQRLLSGRMFTALGAVTIGGLLGVLGLFGPGSWIAAAVIGAYLWHTN